MIITRWMARFAAYGPAAGLAVGSLLACLWVQARPIPGSAELALVFPPWWGARQAFLAASPAGEVVRFGLLPSIVIIAVLPGGAAPGATGAWAVLDPRALGGCRPVPTSFVSSKELPDE